MPMQRSAPNWPRFLWHYRVHKDRVGEQLIFVRLAFAPVFDRDVVEAGVRAACELRGVRGVISYELFGPYDVLLRVWLPRGINPGDFQETLLRELEPAGEAFIEVFVVDYAVRHFLFADHCGKPLLPEDAALHHLQAEEILQIEAGFPDQVPPELLKRLVDEHLLAPFQQNGSVATANALGIKFAVSVSGASDLNRSDLISFEREIVRVLDSATSIAQRSLYAGFGFGHFLIMGRVDYEAFHHVHSHLVTQLNTAAFRSPYSVRTETHISGQRGYHIAEEGLSGLAASRAPDMRLRGPNPRGSRRTKAEELPKGELFAGRFEVQERLGGGGYATVYRVWDVYEKVERAIKLFNSTDPEVALRELHALRKVDHPNVVKVFWFDTKDDRLYLVAELIEGRRLNDIGPNDLSDLRAAEIVDQVLAALEAVHPNDRRIEELKQAGRERDLLPDEFAELQRLNNGGLIHRDIKPENIMISHDGVVKLVDFNIATPARDPKLTRSGTPGYQAPDAGADRWEPADDLFACGIVLYELLTGAHAYQQPDGKATGAPIDIRARCPDLRPELADVVMCACSASRTDRYGTAHEMRSDLQIALRHLRAGSEADQIGRVLRERRASLGLSQEQLATDTGVSEADIASFEQARAQPSLTEALALTRALELDLSRLLEGRVSGDEEGLADDEVPLRERRRFQRIRASLPASLSTKAGGEVSGRTHNVSGGGVLLQTPPNVEVVEHLHLVINLENTEVTGEGEVVRVVEDLVAVRFTAMSHDDKARLEHFISER